MDSGPKQRVAVGLAVAAAELVAVEHEEACLEHPWPRRRPWDSNPSCRS